MKTLYQQFRKFLRDNDCEQQFDNAFYTQCGANVLDETLADLLVIDETFLNRCFDWSKTVEGRQFWKELDDKWWSLMMTPSMANVAINSIVSLQ